VSVSNYSLTNPEAPPSPLDGAKPFGHQQRRPVGLPAAKRLSRRSTQIQLKAIPPRTEPKRLAIPLSSGRVFIPKY